MKFVVHSKPGTVQRPRAGVQSAFPPPKRIVIGLADLHQLLCKISAKIDALAAKYDGIAGPVGQYPAQLGKRSAADAPGEGRPRPGMTITEFCQRNGLSRSTYYALRDEGCAPQTFKRRRRALISLEAEVEWREKMEGAHQSMVRSPQ